MTEHERLLNKNFYRAVLEIVRKADGTKYDDKMNMISDDWKFTPAHDVTGQYSDGTTYTHKVANRWELSVDWGLVDEKGRRVTGTAYIEERDWEMGNVYVAGKGCEQRTLEKPVFDVSILSERNGKGYGAIPPRTMRVTLGLAKEYGFNGLVNQGKRYFRKYGKTQPAAPVPPAVPEAHYLQCLCGNHVKLTGGGEVDFDNHSGRYLFRGWDGLCGVCGARYVVKTQIGFDL